MITETNSVAVATSGCPHCGQDNSNNVIPFKKPQPVSCFTAEAATPAVSTQAQPAQVSNDKINTDYMYIVDPENGKLTKVMLNGMTENLNQLTAKVAPAGDTNKVVQDNSDYIITKEGYYIRKGAPVEELNPEEAALYEHSSEDQQRPKKKNRYNTFCMEKPFAGPSCFVGATVGAVMGATALGPAGAVLGAVGGYMVGTIVGLLRTVVRI